MESASTPASQSPKSDSEQSLGLSNESNTKLEDSDGVNPATVGGLIRPWLAPAVALVVLVADYLTKAWALVALQDEPIGLALGAQFRLYYNDGAAFSTGGGLGPVFGAAAIAVSMWLFWMARDKPHKGAQVVLGMIAGGALGNVGDRLFRRGDGFLGGLVVDFIDVGWWPVFNVADMGIVCGVVAMIFLVMRNPDL